MNLPVVLQRLSAVRLHVLQPCLHPLLRLTHVHSLCSGNGSSNSGEALEAVLCTASSGTQGGSRSCNAPPDLSASHPLTASRAVKLQQRRQQRQRHHPSSGQHVCASRPWQLQARRLLANALPAVHQRVPLPAHLMVVPLASCVSLRQLSP